MKKFEPMMKFTEAMSRETAQAIHADWCEKPWDDASEDDREDSRRSARAALAVVERHLGPVLAGLELFFQRPDEGATEYFDRVADVFHRETGYLRPGKDCRLHDFDTRKAEWDKWVARKLAAARALLPQMEEEPEPCPDCDGTGEVSIPTDAKGNVDFLCGTHKGHTGPCQNCNGTGELE